MKNKMLRRGQIPGLFLCSCIIISTASAFFIRRTSNEIRFFNLIKSPTFIRHHHISTPPLLPIPCKKVKTNLASEKSPNESAELLFSNASNFTCADERIELNSTIDDTNGEFFDAAGPIFEKKLDYVGAGTLGDIMSDPNEEDPNEDSLTGEVLLEKSNQTSISKVFFAKEERQNNQSGRILRNRQTNKQNNEKLYSSRQKSPTKSGLVTTAGGNLQSQFRNKIKNPSLSPLERIALTANGSLQRIFSSYYDAPVHVHVDRCEVRSCPTENTVTISPNINVRKKNGKNYGKSMSNKSRNQSVWDRTVRLSVHDQIFCIATSTITIHCPLCEQLVESGEVGIGQLFRYLDKLPTFELLDAGRNKDGGLWRHYILKCKELTCNIKEDFSENAWSITAIDDFFPE